MRPVFAATLAYLIATRLWELALSRRNADTLLRRGARAIEPDGLAALVVVHVGWIAGLVAEETLGPHTVALPHAARVAAGTLFVLAELARYACMASLGVRWTARVVVLDSEPPVATGPYRFLRHPNYAAVVVSVAALPLALGLPWTAAVFTPLKVLALARRVRIEDRAVYGSG